MIGINIRRAIRNDVTDLMVMAKEWMGEPFYYYETKKKMLEAFFNNPNENRVIYIMEFTDDEYVRYEPIGYCEVIIIDEWLTKARRLLINSVYITKDYRKRGLGTTLIKSVIRKCSPDITFVETREAEGFYRSLGFKMEPTRYWLEKVKE